MSRPRWNFAQKLLQAKDAEEMLKLQGDYVKTQTQVQAEQAREIAQLVAKSVSHPGSRGN
jgi:hypothetical protein